MFKITKISARQILDSRGNPTVQAVVELDNGVSSAASVPSGASTGRYEVIEKRDGNKNYYQGLSVLGSVDTIKNKISPLLKGRDISGLTGIDMSLEEADGTPDFSNYGGNAILPVSMACYRAYAASLNIPLYRLFIQISGLKNPSKPPVPLFNFINGGLHGNRNLTIQEFLIIPSFQNGFDNLLEKAVFLYQSTGKKLENKGMSTGLGDEGGFVTGFSSNEEAIEFLIEVINESGRYRYGSDVSLGLDMASNTFFRQNKYYLRKGIGQEADGYISEIENLVNKYGLILLEDPLAEDDWLNWTRLSAQLDSKINLVADDLIVTNVKRLERAVNEKACNSLIIKINQIGTVSRALETLKKAKNSGFKFVISHRSGETNDDFISDLAVGVGADFVKFGALARGERIAKYNRMLTIIDNS